MSALREHIISIGGADEHIDYLGQICGPYKMTFRLINAEKIEIWHAEDYLYHTWHPGTDGEYDHMGLHDVLHRSHGTDNEEATPTPGKPYASNSTTRWRDLR